MGLERVELYLADKENKKVERVRDWLFHKLNKSKPDISDTFQRGCPDVVPGLTGKPWWYFLTY